MSRVYLTPIDLQQNELQNARVQNLAAAPANPVPGQLYYDTAGNQLYWWDGTMWVAAGSEGGGGGGAPTGPAGGALSGTYPNPGLADGSVTDAKIAAGAAIALSKLAVDPLDRANHTGTQTASTISDFDTEVRTSRLDQMAAPTGAVALNGQRISGLADPTAATDAATRSYVDNATTGLTSKAGKYATSVGGATSQVVTHNLGTQDAVVSVRSATAPYNEVDCDVEYTDANTVTLRFSVAPAANAYRCTVVG